jgi:hypothetical protein
VISLLAYGRQVTRTVRGKDRTGFTVATCWMPSGGPGLHPYDSLAAMTPSTRCATSIYGS